jgi:hypothetical protein
MALKPESCAAELSPTQEALAEWLALPECIIHDMIQSFVQLHEEVGRDGLGTELVRSRLYDILQRVEGVLPDHPQVRDNWVAIRTQLIRTAFACRDAAGRGVEPHGGGPTETLFRLLVTSPRPAR